ncbi:class I tRNA ligase family protein [Roseibium marinum]|uniref:leucine--tRNA ligase n=1 Tax=Roseibium marinum TaxID=281252 RepID=A0A2S3UQA8_9HYPH|nr:class I tRNA ligase family protein [Roseibium marinum]POF29679.1 leucyl-tRNA synthetase [Roseibium marinum]
MPCEEPPVADPFADFAGLEAKWQKRWQLSGCFKARQGDKKDKFYNFDGGPFPNGALHMGHVRTFVLGDVMARYQRMRGKNVLYCFEFDAFGLPNELAAEKQGAAPRDLTAANIERMRGQMVALGLSYDWDHVHSTCDPRYYKWTQWLFLKLREAGLVYRAEADLNWCKSCRTTLAHIQVEDGNCWRCETPVETRSLTQWYVKLSRYSRQLHDSLGGVSGFGPQVRNTLAGFMGAVEGYEIDLPVVDEPDTVITAFVAADRVRHPASYVAIAPGHPAAGGNTAPGSTEDRLKRPHSRASPHEDHRTHGHDTGRRVLDPRTGRTLPVYAAKYVEAGFAHGATLGFPDMDQRDRMFARTRGIIESGETCPVETGMTRPATHFRVRDWLVSRQRAWGTPIPIVHCEHCGTVPVPDAELPVLLPDIPAGGLRNGLADLRDFICVPCPRCGNEARRETDTLDCYFDVIWCFLACTGLLDENFEFQAGSFTQWMQVDWFHNGLDSFFYMHLYRFLGHALYDMGLLQDPEPFANYAGHNVVTLNGRKMSKHHGNVISPEKVLRSAGADVLRVHVLWSANPNKGFEWSDDGLDRARALLKTVWSLNETAVRIGAQANEPVAGQEQTRASGAVRAKIRRAVRRSTGFLEKYQYSGVLNEIHGLTRILKAALAERHPATDEAFKDGCDSLIRLIAPFAPHLAEEAWSRHGRTTLLAATTAWPQA